MNEYTKTDFEEAVKSIESTLHKCEKALEKLKQGTPQWTLTHHRIKAFRLSLDLMAEPVERGFAPFLSFTGLAEEAMRFYAAVFPGAKITKLERYGKDHLYAGEGEENNVLYGALSFKGREIMFLDMTAAHPAPDFSWASSVYIDCDDEPEFDVIFRGLSEGGTVMMGPEPVAHFRKCAWVTDKFGVTWQPVWE